jgi:hypothetical protein
MNTNIALVLVLALFLGFLINVFFGKALENHFPNNRNAFSFGFFYCNCLFL